MSLEGKLIKDSYKDLLIVDNNNAGVDGTMRAISDGEGTASALKVSSTGVVVEGSLGSPNFTSRDSNGYGKGQIKSESNYVTYDTFGAFYGTKFTQLVGVDTKSWLQVETDGDVQVGATGALTISNTGLVSSGGNKVMTTANFVFDTNTGILSINTSN